MFALKADFKEIAMELDELTAVWRVLDRRLERENQLSWQLLRQQRLDKVRGSLQPLKFGQMLQIGFGLLFMLLATLLWGSAPDAPAVIAAGVVVHGYGLGCIILAAVVLAALSNLDYAAPVLTIQTQLAKVRRLYILSGMVAGLPWWFLWLPIIMVLAGINGVDLYAHTPLTVWFGITLGVAGLLGTAWFHRWSRSAKRPELAQQMEDSITGNSLRSAQAQLAELARFEQD